MPTKRQAFAWLLAGYIVLLALAGLSKLTEGADVDGCGPWAGLITQEFRAAGIEDLAGHGCRVVACESTNDPNALGDNGHSRGLWQINDVYHAEVSPAQAFDPAWATAWAARQWANGLAREWSCYRILFEPSPTPPPALIPTELPHGFCG